MEAVRLLLGDVDLDAAHDPVGTARQLPPLEEAPRRFSASASGYSNGLAQPVPQLLPPWLHSSPFAAAARPFRG